MILSTYSSPPSPTRCNDEVDIGFGYCSPHHVLGYYYCSPHHRQAQRLNNTAVTCIIAMEENGGHRNRKGGQPKQQQINQHEKAISILEKALRICEREEDQEHDYAYDVCSCYDCSIDGCIVSNDDDYNGTEMNEDNADGSTIDENPIYVYEGHNMGSTLTYIIAFNLAIAHHLTAMEMANDAEKHDVIKQERIVNKALQFYELAYECNLTNTCSMRFDMIICNNLSHIYRHQEQQQSAQQHVVELEPQDEPQPQQVQLPQETPPAQSPSSQAIIIDEDDEIDADEEDISFEYYSQQEEEEEYEHNSTLVSLLTTRSTVSSSYTSSTTPTSTKNDLSQNGVSSHHYSTSPLLTFDHQKEESTEFCVTSTPERDSSSIRSMYTTCIV
mmetsp:Transcript_50742/g.57459  ORF Transcript_50742/g.57459 Transcript_50742/m.57459 type:complete len:386 (+) Transcript_50742:138-1295(+)